MARTVGVGDTAPNFDLASTEDAVIMLRDEVPRTSVLLYFFDGAAERSRHDLLALAGRQPALAKLRVNVLGVSPAKLDELKALQRDLGLGFPLLRDDRGLAADYGFVPAEGDAETDPVLVLVSRQQKVLWMASPPAAMDEALRQVLSELKRQPTPTDNYPRSVINRLVDRWVN